MAQYAYQQITIAGAAITPVTPTASDTVTPDDRGFLLYENSNAAVRNIAIVTPAGLNFGGVDLGNITRQIAATTGRALMGPLVGALADPVTGLITITIDNTAGNNGVKMVEVIFHRKFDVIWWNNENFMQTELGRFLRFIQGIS